MSFRANAIKLLYCALRRDLKDGRIVDFRLDPKITQDGVDLDIAVQPAEPLEYVNFVYEKGG